MKHYVKEHPKTAQELTSGEHPSVYAVDMVLTNNPSIDEGQIMEAQYMGLRIAIPAITGIQSH
jgi:hypothetical protein